jgi:hypothetical protein
MRALHSLTYCIRASTVTRGAIGITKEGDRNLGPKAQPRTSPGRPAPPRTRRAPAMVAVAAAALLVAALSVPPAGAQSGGGAPVPGSGGAPSPDLAPVAPSPEPDPAPGGDSGTVRSSPAPAPTSPAPTAPAPTTPIAPASPSSQTPELRGGSRVASARAATRGEKKKAARKSRAANRAEKQGSARPPDRTWVFGESLPLSQFAGSGTDTESTPAQLIALALLALVLAGASFLMLTARLSREWRV